MSDVLYIDDGLNADWIKRARTVTAAMALELGDSEGHPFRGNQWTTGLGEGKPEWTPSNTPGTTLGGLSTNIKELGLEKTVERRLTSAFKSKGFTINAEKEAELHGAKMDALRAIGAKLGWTPEQTAAAIANVNGFMSDWQVTGGQSVSRDNMEAAWTRLQNGQAPETDWDRAAVLQKTYTDIQWDTKGNPAEIEMIRGIGGEYAQRLSLASALGEDWSMSTWPLTSWAVPDAERSVTNWTMEGVMLHGQVSRDETFAMYSGEPLLREVGLKVKGEYITDGAGALDDQNNTLEPLTGGRRAGTLGGGSQDDITSYVRDGLAFHEQTGGSSDDFALGRAVYNGASGGDWGRFTLDGDKNGAYWQVLGYEKPPAIRELSVSYNDYPGTWAERVAAQQTDQNVAYKEMATVLAERGHTPESVTDVLVDWAGYRRAVNDLEEYRAGVAAGVNPDAKWDDRVPRDQGQLEYWRDRLIPDTEIKATHYKATLDNLRAQLGIDDVPLPDPTKAY